MVVSDSSCAYSDVTRAASLVSYGSYSIVSVGVVEKRDWGLKGCCCCCCCFEDFDFDFDFAAAGCCCCCWGFDASSPFMVIEWVAVVKVLFMNYI